LQAERTNLEKVRNDLAVAVRQRDELRRKISGQDNGRVILQAGTPSPQEIQSATALDARIRESKQRLDDLLQKYTDRHPRYSHCKKPSNIWKSSAALQLGGVLPTHGSRSEGSSVPIDPVVQNLQIALNIADVQVAAMQTQETQSQAQVAQLQHLVRPALKWRQSLPPWCATME